MSIQKNKPLITTNQEYKQLNRSLDNNSVKSCYCIDTNPLSENKKPPSLSANFRPIDNRNLMYENSRNTYNKNRLEAIMLPLMIKSPSEMAAIN